MASSCVRGCLLFSLALNTIWLLLYFFSSKNPRESMPPNSVFNGRKVLYTGPSGGVLRNSSHGDTGSQDTEVDVLFRSLDSRITFKPYIFIGGVPSSGTTLIRAMLDAHPDIRCGEETRIVPRILQMRERWRRSKIEHTRLTAAGLNDSTLNKIVRQFVSNVIELHGPKARNLCNKDPLSLSQMPLLHELFPKARFLLMIRDGRAVASSIVSRNVTISGVDHKSFVSAAMFWNKAIEKMWNHCTSIGTQFCMPVHFEKLVESPKEEMEKILMFLDIPWNGNVLHHSDFLSSEVSLSKYEPSTRQVQNAISQESVDKWKRKIPRVMQNEIWKRCPMLQKLGYRK